MSPLLLSLTWVGRWVGSDHTRWEGGWLLLGWGEGVYSFQYGKQVQFCTCEHPSFYLLVFFSFKSGGVLHRLRHLAWGWEYRGERVRTLPPRIY